MEQKILFKKGGALTLFFSEFRIGSLFFSLLLFGCSSLFSQLHNGIKEHNDENGSHDYRETGTPAKIDIVLHTTAVVYD